MNITSLFRRLVFAQVLLGIVAFCIAERSPGLLLVAGAVGALSWYVVEGPMGRPLPQWVIAPCSILAVAYLVTDLFIQKGQVVLAMGHFMMWLQIILLYGKKDNREYSEILVLSLMLVLAASVLTSGMSYAIILLIYSLLALLTLLSFQLKVTSDLVRESNQYAAPSDYQQPKPLAVVGRGYKWHLRLFTISIGACCALVAAGIFLVVPRTKGGKISNDFVPARGQSQTGGFSTKVDLSSTLSHVDNQSIIAYVTLANRSLLALDASQSFLLRGTSLDEYNAETKTWARNTDLVNYENEIDLPRDGKLSFGVLTPKSLVWDAQLTVLPVAGNCLFTFAGSPVGRFKSQVLDGIVYNTVDLQLSTPLEYDQLSRYHLVSPVRPTAQFIKQYAIMPNSENPIRQNLFELSPRSENFKWKPSRQKIQAFTLGILQRNQIHWDAKNINAKIAKQAVQTLVEYLRTNYEYQLTTGKVLSNVDPTSAFLFRKKAGHCELFASALAAMTRTIGLASRVVTGLRVSEFNPFGQYYVVRQSNAHAWTEVFCKRAGWLTFDATPAAAVAAEHASMNHWWTSLRDRWEHFEYLWRCKINAYNTRAQRNLIEKVRKSVVKKTDMPNSLIRRVTRRMKNLARNWAINRLGYTMIMVILAGLLIATISLVHTMLVRRKRLLALQLTKLPRKQKRLLVKRLHWYLQMLDLLERHGHVRCSWQSPLDFSLELSKNNPKQFNTVVTLTEFFYEIRFGHRDLDRAKKAQIKQYMKQLESVLL